jgi:predicted membrane protein DUF2306
LLDVSFYGSLKEGFMAEAPRFRAGYVVFAFIAAMAAYVLYHNERFLIDAAHPAWQHYEPFKWWLLPHGVAGACALILAPMQFSERLRLRFTTLHRVTGGIYVTSALFLAPLGVYIQFLDEAQGASRSFTIATVVDAALLMTTTTIGLVFALKGMFPQHRQWMTRSYAVSLTFLEIRFILGLTGLDQPFNWAILEVTVWTCVALSILIGDLANQWYELASARPRPARTKRAETTALSPAE